MTVGPAEHAIRGTVRTGTVLTTPSRGAPFTVSAIDSRGVVLLLGEQEAHTRLTWEVLEGTVDALGGDWMPIGSRYSTATVDGTLDGYLKRYIKRATAGWVAALLEAAGVAEIDRGRPARIRRCGDLGMGPV